jgi:hypothetical protein
LLTDEGRRAARRFGEALGARVASVTTSPVRRCFETAIAIAAGAAVNLQPGFDRLLGGPGAFVVDEERAWENWLRLGNAAVIEHVATSDEPLPGMAVPREAAHRLLCLLQKPLGDDTGVHIFVTHDTVLAPFVSRSLAISHVLWPDFLAAAILWREGTDTRLWFDGRSRAVAHAVASGR